MQRLTEVLKWELGLVEPRECQACTEMSCLFQKRILAFYVPRKFIDSAIPALACGFKSDLTLQYRSKRITNAHAFYFLQLTLMFPV